MDTKGWLPEETGAVEPKENQDYVSDFSTVLHEFSSSEFALRMHKRLMQQTKLNRSARAQFDMEDINRVLAEFPSLYAWSIVEAELIAEKLEEAEAEYEEYYRIKYDSATNKLLAEGSKKPTKDAIETQIVKSAKLAYEAQYNELYAKALSDEDIKHELRYKGLEGRKRYIRELKTKARIAKEFNRVWSNVVPCMQTLSRNINAEFEASKRTV